MCSQVQHAGRCARNPRIHGLFLCMPEPWAFTEICDPELESYKKNPDLPFPSDAPNPTPASKTKSIPKNQRVSQGSLAYIQTSSCRREFQARYLGDESPNGLISRTLYIVDHTLTPSPQHWTPQRVAVAIMMTIYPSTSSYLNRHSLEMGVPPLVGRGHDDAYIGQ